MDIYVRNNRIYFLEREQGVLASTDYVPELWEVVNTTSWYIQKNKKGKPKYLRSSKYSKSLHQIVMIYWYGEEVFEEMRKRNFVIDHIDNDGFNCDINNLTYLYKNENTAKGLTYDIERKNTERVAALNIFKDFNSRRFQITIGFNRRYSLMIGAELIPITTIKLLYNDDYIVVLNDAKNILHGINSYNRVNLSKLNYIDMKYEKEVLLKLVETEKESPIIIEDGKPFLILNENQWITRVAPDKELFDR